MNVTPFTSKRTADEKRRYADHYHLKTPEDAVDKYGIKIEQARAIFRKYGLRMTPKGHLYMHPDTLEAYMREPWKFESGGNGNRQYKKR